MCLLKAVLVVFQLSVICSQTCQNKFYLPAVINDNTDKIIRLNDCFANRNLTKEITLTIKITCSTEQLPVIQKKFIADFELLSLIVIECSVTTVLPEAFFNLPNLVYVDLSNNQIKAITAGVFDIVPSLQYISLRNNSIAYIGELSFANLPKLNIIGLDKNELNYMSRYWFINTRNIEVFSITRNYVKEIPENMFQGWRAVKSFIMNYNNISKINDGAFIDLGTHVSILALRHNELSSINMNAFSDNMSFESIDISLNLLNYVPSDFFKKITVNYMFIFGNPFKCSCLLKLYNRLYAQGIFTNALYYNLDNQTTKIHLKTAPNRFCKQFSAPICGGSVVPSVCTETSESDINNRITNYMMEEGFNNLKEWHTTCTPIKRGS